MLGPGQILTGKRDGVRSAPERVALSWRINSRAPLPSWWQMHSLTATPLASAEFTPPICSILRPWYSREAVQTGVAVNSVLDTKNPLGQADPGRPSENLRHSSTSEDEPRRLLNGTPNGELSEREMSSGPLSAKSSRVC